MDRILRFRPLLVCFGLSAILSGCTINSDIMFKTPNDYQFETFPDTVATNLFKIQPNDMLEFRLFANDGYKMIDMVSESAGRDLMMINRMTFTYFVEFDGLVKLPLLGRVPIAGLTTREAELLLEERYVEFYNRPFVQLQVMNRRVVVFTGQAGMSRTIPLDNNNTTLMEVLANAGGLSRRGKAKKVKLFRLDAQGGRKVYQFDLSTIDGLRHADIVMEGDDIVYVQPNAEIAREVLTDLNPIIALLTTVLLVIGIAQGLRI
jgi:polysaccharide biosynthesis/export protein